MAPSLDTGWPALAAFQRVLNKTHCSSSAISLFLRNGMCRAIVDREIAPGRADGRCSSRRGGPRAGGKAGSVGCQSAGGRRVARSAGESSLDVFFFKQKTAYEI